MMRALGRRMPLLLLWLAAGCSVLGSVFGPAPAPGSVQQAPPPPPPVSAELAMLPGGMELVAELDVLQLQQWPLTRRFGWLAAWLPEDSAGPLGKLVRGRVPNVEQAALAAAPSDADATLGALLLILAGPLDRDTGRALLDAAQPSGRASYHGATIEEQASVAYARLDRTVAAYGPPAEVRRAVDVQRGEEPRVTAAPTDRVLMSALAQAPTAKTGRPAVRGALRFNPVLRQRLGEAGVPDELLERLDWLAVAVAVGDGADLGMVAGLRDAQAAAAFAERVHHRLEELKGRPSVARLGLHVFLDAIRVVRRQSQVHFAWRLEQRRLMRLLDRIDLLLELGRPPPAPPLE